MPELVRADGFNAMLQALRSNPVCLRCGTALDERRLMNPELPLGLCHECSRGQPGQKRSRLTVRGVVVRNRPKPPMTLENLWKRDRGVCWLCLWPVPLEHATRDHVVPLSGGGKNRQENLRLAHDACNGERHGVKDVPLGWLSVAGWIVHADHFTWFEPVPAEIRSEALRVRNRGCRFPKRRARPPGWDLTVTSERPDRLDTAGRSAKWEAGRPQTTYG